MPHLAGRVRTPESRASSAEAVVFPQLGLFGEQRELRILESLGPSSGWGEPSIPSHSHRRLSPSWLPTPNLNLPLQARVPAPTVADASLALAVDHAFLTRTARRLVCVSRVSTLCDTLPGPRRKKLRAPGSQLRETWNLNLAGLPAMCSIGALIIRIGFWGPFYYIIIIRPLTVHGASRRLLKTEPRTLLIPFP